jgi:hypothetical protein
VEGNAPSLPLIGVRSMCVAMTEHCPPFYELLVGVFKIDRLVLYLNESFGGRTLLSVFSSSQMDRSAHPPVLIFSVEVSLFQVLVQLFKVGFKGGVCFGPS